MNINTNNQKVLHLVDVINDAIIDINYFGEQILLASYNKNLKVDKKTISAYIVAVRRYNTAITSLSLELKGVSFLAPTSYDVNKTVRKLEPIWVELTPQEELQEA